MTDGGDLISLVTRSIGDGPHNLVLPLEEFKSIPSIRQQATWGENRLRIDGLEVETAHAEIWKTQPDWTRVRAARERIQNAIPMLVELLQQRAPDPGILELLRGNPSGRSSIEDHFVDAILEPARLLISALQESHSKAALEAALGLSGLGSGFTPAGDDYLCGAMLACWSGFSDRDMRRSLPWIAQQAGRRTNRISAAYLQSAAIGEFGEIWHIFLEDLLRADRGRISQTTAKVISIGHNSGAYTLTGFIQVVNGQPAETGRSTE